MNTRMMMSCPAQSLKSMPGISDKEYPPCLSALTLCPQTYTPEILTGMAGKRKWK